MAKQIPHLKRYPDHPKDLLQAWDSADELLLSEVLVRDLGSKRILVLNDQFGALSSTLTSHLGPGTGEAGITSYTDSYVSARGISLNSEGSVHPVSDLASLSGPYDLAIMKLPKNLSFFEDELAHLSSVLAPGSQLIVGAMIKHLPKTAFDLIQKYIGETHTSLAEKKARLIFATLQKPVLKSPYPLRVKLDGFETAFLNYSNLFSREKLDVGTRFFLQHIPSGNFKTILDLGCANGVVGICAKQKNPSAQVIFSDESAMAIQSARENYAAYFQDEAKFIWTNCYENQEKDSLDLVLCNPPFHQSTTIGDFIAWQMFQDAHASIKPGGLLRVIGNSHLGYQLKLKKIFGNSKVIATNAKFMIIDAVKMPG